MAGLLPAAPARCLTGLSRDGLAFLGGRPRAEWATAFQGGDQRAILDFVQHGHTIQVLDQCVFLGSQADEWFLVMTHGLEGNAGLEGEAGAEAMGGVEDVAGVLAMDGLKRILKFAHLRDDRDRIGNVGNGATAEAKAKVTLRDGALAEHGVGFAAWVGVRAHLVADLPLVLLRVLYELVFCILAARSVAL